MEIVAKLDMADTLDDIEEFTEEANLSGYTKEDALMLLRDKMYKLAESESVTRRHVDSEIRTMMSIISQVKHFEKVCYKERDAAINTMNKKVRVWHGRGKEDIENICQIEEGVCELKKLITLENQLINQGIDPKLLKVRKYLNEEMIKDHAEQLKAQYKK